MVLILQGNSEIGAHVRSEIGYLIYLRHLNRSRAVTNLMIAITIDIFAYFCVEKSNSFDLQKTFDNIIQYNKKKHKTSDCKLLNTFFFKR